MILLLEHICNTPRWANCWSPASSENNPMQPQRLAASANPSDSS